MASSTKRSYAGLVILSVFGSGCAGGAVRPHGAPAQHPHNTPALPISVAPSWTPPSAVLATPARAPSDGALIGTAAPTRVLDASPDARWVVVAQTRADTDGDGRVEFHLEEDDGHPAQDATVSYLVSGSGEGEAIDRYCGRDPSGRYVAYAAQQRLWLRDTVEGLAWNLGPSPLASTPQVWRWCEDGGALQFAHEGHRLLYTHDAGERRDVIVRDLGSGREHVIDPGDGVLRDARLDAWGELVTLWVDPRTDASTDRSRTEVRVATVDSGRARVVEGLVSAFGRRFVVRTPDGGLVVRGFDGREEPWVPASCDARVMHADPRRDLIVVQCEGDSTRGRTDEVRDYQHGIERLSLRVEGANVPRDPRASQPVRVRSFPSRVLRLDASGYVLLDLDGLHVTRLDSDETWCGPLAAPKA